MAVWYRGVDHVQVVLQLRLRQGGVLVVRFPQSCLYARIQRRGGNFDGFILRTPLHGLLYACEPLMS